MPPVNIQMENRREYYETIRMFQHSGDMKPTIDLIIKEYKKMEKELNKEGKGKAGKKTSKTRAQKTRKSTKKKI